MDDPNAVHFDDIGTAAAVGAFVNKLIDGIEAWRPLRGVVKVYLAPVLSFAGYIGVYTANAYATGAPVPIAKIILQGISSYGTSQASYVIGERKQAAEEKRKGGPPTVQLGELPGNGSSGGAD